MKKILIAILIGLSVCSCGSYKLVYQYNDNWEITEKYYIKEEKSKQINIYKALDEYGNKINIAVMDIPNKERKNIKKKFK